MSIPQIKTMEENISIELTETISWWEKFQPSQRLLTGSRYTIAKRMMDLVVVGFALPFLLPLFAIVALLIWIDSPGAPVLFTQKRTGKDGIRFNMFKFRTMVPNAEAMKQELMHLNELQWPDFKISNDPRITRIGKFLRKTSLDELPQLLNVLNGTMSLVGPRPTSFAAETYAPQHLRRLEVTPGLTGLWQIIGRASMEFDERVELDVAYIERRGLAL
ncbi:MAG: sugar transferase, partial [Chloroflexi bacterium]|nr:sugar transferase [Chloroflexota bacterium]